MSTANNIEINLYEPWMREQLVQMVCGEYHLEKELYGSFIQKFYEHTYQREKSLRIVALDGQKVIGFQTFFYWPFLLDGKLINSYQSGNSIVDINYRGRGVFSRLLNYLDEIKKVNQIDLLVGFPSSVSLNSFIRNRWANVLNLDWYTKILNPISIIRKFDMQQIVASGSSACVCGNEAAKGFTLSCDLEFENWRKSYSASSRYFYFHYDKGDRHLRFDFKLNMRGWLKELIVGRVKTNCYDPNFLKKALGKLIQEAHQRQAFTFVSVALNGQYFESEILTAFHQAGFKRINKKIFFIVKDYNVGGSVYKPGLWQLYRSDVDTW